MQSWQSYNLKPTEQIENGGAPETGRRYPHVSRRAKRRFAAMI
jgi:hypothetical protein